MNSVFVRYINLDRRPDRDKDTLGKIINLGFDLKKIKRFSAIDGKKITNDLKDKKYIENKFIKILQTKNLNAKVGELGCLLSHWFLLNEIYNDEMIGMDSYVFIFEDDFFINDVYLETTNLDTIIDKLNTQQFDGDIIYFGGRFKVNFTPSKNAYEKFFSHSFDNFYLRIKGQGLDWDRTTHNYLVKKKNIPKILNCIVNYYSSQNRPKFQVDHMLSSLSSQISMYDYFPHLFYSPMNYSTDIQNSSSSIKLLELK